MPMWAQTYKSGRRYYREHRESRSNTQCPAHGGSIPCRLADEQVGRIVEAIELGPAWQEQLLSIISARDEVEVVQAKRRKVQERLRRLAKTYVDGVYDDQDYKRQKRNLEMELESLVVPKAAAAAEAGKLGIQTGVAVAFFVREKSRLGECNIHYASREDAEVARDKLAYLKETGLDSVPFESIKPDAKNNWLNQSNSNFERLIPLADRQTKLAKSAEEERAVFGIYSLGVITARDEWVYDFDAACLGRKVRSFINEYEESRARHGGKVVEGSDLGTTIKWTRDLKRQLLLDIPNTFDRDSISTTVFRPFVTKKLYFNQNLNEMQYQLPQIFTSVADTQNKVICFCVNGKDFYALARIHRRRASG